MRLSVFDTVPEAEVIQDELEMEPEPFSEDELEPKPDTEYLQAETVTEAGAEIKEDTADETDELKALDALDEENMLEHTEEALLTEPETETKQEELQELPDGGSGEGCGGYIGEAGRGRDADGKRTRTGGCSDGDNYGHSGS